MRRLVIALATLAAAPVWAQEQSADSRAANASEVLARAEAGDLFDILADDQTMAVRHARSGLVCRMDRESINRVIVFPQAARGEDVACDSTDGHESTTLYATRYSFETTLQEQVAAAEEAIRRRFPNARPYPGGDAGDGASRTLEFLVSRADGTRMYTRASVALVNGWSIKLRYSITAPDDGDAAHARVASDAIWRRVMEELSAPPRS